MKKSFLYPLVLLSLSATVFFSGCSNFMNGSSLADDINKKIEYEQSRAYEFSFSSKYGKISPNGIIEKKETDPVNISFNPDVDYQFIQWKAFSDSRKTVEIPAEYIHFDDSETQETNFTFIKAFPDTDRIYIEPVCVKRPKVVSATPSYDADGVYRDRRITIMFDQKLDSDSIFYSKEELIEEEVWDPKKGLKSEYELLGDTSSPYGYKNITTGDIVWKCLSITKLSDQSVNLLDCYEYPVFDVGNTSVLRISTKTNLTEMPPVSTDILVTIKNVVGAKYPVNESKQVSVGLSSDYSWTYFTNTKNDNEPPKIDKVQLYVLKNGTTKCEFKDDGIVESYKNKVLPLIDSDSKVIIPSTENLQVLNLSKKDKDGNSEYSTNLWLKANVLDYGSGPSALTMKIYRIHNDFYNFNQVKVDDYRSNVILDANTSEEYLGEPDFVYTANLTITGSVGTTSYYDSNGTLHADQGNLIELVNDNTNNTLTEDGVYAVQLYSTDKNGLSSVYENMYYFVIDNNAPQIDDSITFTEHRREAKKASVSWKNPSISDLCKYSVTVYKGDQVVNPENCEAKYDCLASKEMVFNTEDIGLTLENLTKYKYQFSFYDAAGNISNIREIIDNDTPHIDDSVKFTESRKEIKKASVSWKNPSISDLSKYSVTVYKGNQVINPGNCDTKYDCYDSKDIVFSTANIGLTLEELTKYKYQFTFYDFSGNASNIIEVIDNDPPKKSSMSYKSTIGMCKAKMNFTKSTSEDYYKTVYSPASSSNAIPSNSTEVTVDLVGNSRRHTDVTITDYDFSGNSITTSVTGFSTVPVIGMIYYIDGYWSKEYVADKEPVGIIWKLDENGYSYRGVKYGNARILDLYRDTTARKVIKDYWSSTWPNGWTGTPYCDYGIAMYKDVTANSEALSHSEIFSYLYNVKNKEKKWIDAGIEWYLPSVNEIIIRTYGFVYFKTTIQEGYNILINKNKSDVNLYSFEETTSCTINADGGSWCYPTVYLHKDAYYNVPKSGGYYDYCTPSLYMAHVTLR